MSTDNLTSLLIVFEDNGRLLLPAQGYKKRNDKEMGIHPTSMEKELENNSKANNTVRYRE
jgi:hypothetical protein